MNYENSRKQYERVNQVYIQPTKTKKTSCCGRGCCPEGRARKGLIHYL